MMDQVQFGLRNKELIRTAKLSGATKPETLADDLKKLEGVVSEEQVATTLPETVAAIQTSSFQSLKKFD